MVIIRWSIPNSDCLFSAAEDGEALYSQQKQDQELTVAQTMNSLLPNSDLQRHSAINGASQLDIGISQNQGSYLTLYNQQKQDQELTVAQIMNSLLPNSDLN